MKAYLIYLLVFNKIDLEKWFRYIRLYTIIMIHGRIYKIYCNETGECYYGSTEETLSRRLSKHKTDYKSWKKGKSKYVYSFKILERGNYTISLMEEGEFQNKDYMKARERQFIENNECVNKCVPNRTKKEWYEDNRQVREEKQKQKHTCECGGKYTHNHKKRHEKTKKHLAYIEQK